MVGDLDQLRLTIEHADQKAAAVRDLAASAPSLGLVIL